MSEEDKISDKTLKLVAKIKKEQWRGMFDVIQETRSLYDEAGRRSFSEKIIETVDLEIGKLFSPLTNEITDLLDTALAPILADLSTLVNDLTDFIGKNAQGALTGALVGGVASLFLPGGPILVAIGAVVGAAIQNWFTMSEADRAKAWQNMMFDIDKAIKNWLNDIGKNWESYWKSLGF